MKAIALVLITLFPLLLHAQKIDSASISRPTPEKQEQVNTLMKQGNSARNASLILSIGGGAVFTSGLIIGLATIDNNDGTALGIMALGGIAMAIASIPFTIVKRVKYNKAKAIVFAKPAVSLAPGVIIPHSQSIGIGISIPFGR